MFRPISLFLVAICGVSLLSGCGDGRPTRAQVAGQVMIDGEPLKLGFIRFFPQHGRSSGSAIDEQGHFTLSCFDKNDGALLGHHRVAVYASEPVGDKQVKWYTPKKYASPETSGLECDIDAATEGVEFNLTWGGGRPFFEMVD